MTPKELRKNGLKVRIDHYRVYRVAYKNHVTGKLVVHNKLSNKHKNFAEMGDSLPWELLPKGGKTEITVSDPISGLDFFASSTCRSDDNYDKKVGVEKCMNRITDLVSVCLLKESEKLASLSSLLTK